MTTLHLCHLKNVPIFKQLEIEEALLRAGSGSWCIINEGSPKAIVMGISGIAEELIETEVLRLNPMPVIRRFSGGGTVVIEENSLFVTFIIAKEDLCFGTCPKSLLEWTGTIYKPLFSHTDFAIRENDYAIGNKKIGGNAQYFSKERTLHHTSFLWDYSEELMSVLKLPKKIPEYRQKRSHSDFLSKLRLHFETKEEFISGLKRELEKQFTLIDPAPETIEKTLLLPHRKALCLHQFIV